MKGIFVSFNQALFEDIKAIMDRMNIKGFTSWETVSGRGSNTGEPHIGSHAYPTLNSAFFIVTEDDKAEHFLKALHRLDKKFEVQGLRAFSWSVEQTI